MLLSPTDRHLAALFCCAVAQRSRGKQLPVPLGYDVPALLLRAHAPLEWAIMGYKHLDHPLNQFGV